MKNKLLCVLLTASFLAVSLTGCGNEEVQETVEEEVLDVEVVNPEVGNIDVNSEFVGTLEYKEQTAVYPKLSGEVTEVFFKEGDYVNEGDLLFTLDDAVQQLGLTNAQATYKTAKAGRDQQVGAIQMTVDNNLNNVATAEEGIRKVEDTYNYYESQYGYLQDSKEILEENYDDAEDDRDKAKKQLKKAKAALKEAKKSGGDTTELEAAVRSLESAVDGYESAMDQYQMNINQYGQNQNTMAFNKDELIYSYEQAKRGLALAQENLAYYLTIQAPAIQESAAATLTQAQVGVDSAKLQLGYTQITAPVSGYVQSVNVETHDMAQAGFTAFVITNDGGMNATFTVPESTYRQLSVGQDVKVVRSDNEYSGKITEIPTELDPASGMFKITATLSGNTKELVSGTNVEIYTVTDRVKNVITIPIDCVYYEGGEGFVYIAKDNVIKKCYVETGLYDNEKIEITSGLTKEDKVVTTWSSDLRDGLKVEVKFVSQNEVK